MSNITEESYPLVETLVSEIERDFKRGFDITVVANGKLTETLIKAYLEMGYCPKLIDFDCNYFGEYYIGIQHDMELFVEPAWREKSKYHEAGYCADDSDIVYIESGVNSEIYKYITGRAMTKFSIV